MICVEFVQPLRSAADVDRLKATLKARSVRDWALFVLGVNTGLRVGDLLALRTGEVLAGRGRRVQIARKLELRERKTGKARIIPLNDRVRAALGEYLRGRPGLLPEDPLFPSRKREEGGGMRPIFRQQAWHVLHRAAEEAGLLDRNGRVGSHTMRKTFGYLLYKGGVGVDRIQKMLNHSSPAVTLAYLGITQDELDGYYRQISL